MRVIQRCTSTSLRQGDPALSWRALRIRRIPPTFHWARNPRCSQGPRVQECHAYLRRRSLHRTSPRADSPPRTDLIHQSQLCPPEPWPLFEEPPRLGQGARDGHHSRIEAGFLVPLQYLAKHSKRPVDNPSAPINRSNFQQVPTISCSGDSNPSILVTKCIE